MFSLHGDMQAIGIARRCFSVSFGPISPCTMLTVTGDSTCMQIHSKLFALQHFFQVSEITFLLRMTTAVQIILLQNTCVFPCQTKHKFHIFNFHYKPIYSTVKCVSSCTPNLLKYSELIHVWIILGTKWNNTLRMCIWTWNWKALLS